LPTIRISFQLPYFLLLTNGEYDTPIIGGSVRLTAKSIRTADGLDVKRTVASSFFDIPNDTDAATREEQRRKESYRLLNRVNHLLRWYRATTGDASIVELTRVSASPFWFALKGGRTNWCEPLEYEPRSAPEPRLASVPTGRKIRKGLNGGMEPDVATLNLLDAEYALSVGRFRDAVLLCWGAIDSTFVRKFDSLVDSKMEGDWPPALEFLKGFNFGLRHKMTSGLRLLGGRSLYKEPDDYWKEMTESYRCRNRIIHEGAAATEQEAESAITIARKMVDVVADL